MHVCMYAFLYSYSQQLQKQLYGELYKSCFVSIPTVSKSSVTPLRYCTK